MRIKRQHNNSTLKRCATTSKLRCNQLEKPGHLSMDILHARLSSTCRSRSNKAPHHRGAIFSKMHYGERVELPWQQMTQTYTWVIEHGYVTLDKRDRKTEQWILEQQVFLAVDGSGKRTAYEPGHRRKVMCSHELEAERWMRHEERARLRAAEKERKARLVEDEIRKIEAKIRAKRETERRRITEERRRVSEERLKEQEKRRRMKDEKDILEAWHEYEERWGKLASVPECSLEFKSIPWPVMVQPAKPDDMKPNAIESFLLSRAHSARLMRKERIRIAQLRWHPDRFQRLLSRVKTEHKDQVEKGVGIVARCLNDLMVVVD